MPGYEKIGFQILAKLQAGDYDSVEKFFADAHQNKKLTSAGRDYMSSIFSRWYDSDYYIKPPLADAISGWIKKYPQSPYALLARA